MSGTELQVIEDAEIIEQQPGAITLFGTEDPIEIVAKASIVASALAEVIRKQNLATSISGCDHVRVEGWCLLGSMLGVYPICVWSHPIDDGFQARVEARTRNGDLVGAAEAMCTRKESKWKSRDDYALQSMAQTRATSKALRLSLGFVMTLAGFESTSAEEMPHDVEQRVEPTIPVPRSREEIRALVVPYGEELWEDFKVLMLQSSEHLFPGIAPEALGTWQKTLLLQKAAGAAVKLRESHPGPDMLPPPDVAMLSIAFASVLDGVVLPGPHPETGGAFEEAVEAAMQEDIEFEVPADAKRP